MLSALLDVSVFLYTPTFWKSFRSLEQCFVEKDFMTTRSIRLKNHGPI